MKRFYVLIITLSLFWSCTNLEDATVSNRNTFIRFYEGANAFIANDAAITDDGYIIAGTVRISGDNPLSKIVLIKTDKNGQKIWQTIIDGGAASTIKVINNGYILVGDSLAYNPHSAKISELENSSSRLIRLDNNGNILTDISYHTKKDDAQVDFHGESITTDDQGNIITRGSYQVPNANQYSYVAALNSTFDTLWRKDFSYIDRDYINSKSVFYSGGKVLWGASVSFNIGNFNRSYIAIPVVQENSTFVNSNYFGQNSEQSLKIKDLKPAPIGYAAIGTYAQADGTKGNIFFILTDKNGNFREETISFYDGILSETNSKISDPSLSDSEDTGEAITSTHDGGYVIAGTLETTPTRGNGGKDIWLIKIDAFGNIVWNKLIGGRTNESVSFITETEDKGLIICGTLSDRNAVAGTSSIFLIKTDQNGELKD